jgi:fructan beta-fructosidase
MVLRNILVILLFTCLWAACSTQTTPKVATALKSNLNEPHRPQFHFTPPAKWMNDPNGMVYFKGEYHLFYQHYPDSTVWGPMHWGHAVSKDMIHWEHLPIALYPDEHGLIFSGSVVIDVDNTAGFNKNGETALIAIFTYHNMDGEKAQRTDFQTQGMAYSLDKGRTWTKYANNPIIKNPNIRDFRDPKVMWHTASKQWVMTLAVANHVEFYASKNLKDWAKTGEFGKNEGSHGGVWECPDLFPLAIEGDKSEKWVLLLSIGNGAPNGGSGTQYYIGQFDGKTFKNDNKPSDILWLDYGRDNYAGVTWYGAPSNRRLFLGWMSNWQYAMLVPTKTWRSAMTLPRELSLQNTEKGVRLFQKPVKEVFILRGTSTNIAAQNITNSLALKPYSTGNELSLTFDLSKTTAQDISVVLSNSRGEKVVIGYEKTSNRFYIDRTEGGKKDFEQGFAGRHYAPRSATSNLLTMNLYIDVASVELFADGGATVMTDVFFPTEDFNQLTLESKQGTTYLTEGKMWTLKSTQ